MSRSCQRATFSTAAVALPRSTRARPVMRSVVIGLRLCGIALEPFCWPARKGSSASRTSVRCRWRISVASRSRPGARERDRLQQLGVAVARDDLRGDRLALQAQALEHARLEVGAGRRVGADGAADRADARLARTRAPGARRCGGPRRRSPASLMPKVVGSAWTPCVRPTQTVSTCSRARSASATTSSRAPPTTIAPAAAICSASAVSRTSDEVRPKWIQRPPGPALSCSTSTKAATSWSVTRSRSWTASTVNVAARIASRSCGVGPSISSQAATSTRRHASMRASSVQIAPISGRV